MASVSQYENISVTQIRTSFQNVNFISPGIYDVGLPLALGLLYIRVKYPAGFPNVAPSLVVASNVTHQLIDPSTKAVLFPERLNWSAKITVLSVLQNLNRIFTTNPPMAVVAPQIPRLNELLQNWNGPIEDDADIMEFVSTLEDIQKLINERDELLQKNIEKANENLQKKNEYDNVIAQHQEEINEIENLASELGTLMKQVENVQKQYSSDKVLEKLKEIETFNNKEAGEILKRFMKKEMSLDDFVSEYQVPLKKAKFIQLVREAR